MKHRLLNGSATFQVLHHDPLEQFRRDGFVPHALWIHDDDRPLGADAKTWRFATLHAGGTEEQPFAFEQARQLRIQRTSPAIRGAETTRAYEHVPLVRLHERLRFVHGSISRRVCCHPAARRDGARRLVFRRSHAPRESAARPPDRPPRTRRRRGRRRPWGHGPHWFMHPAWLMRTMPFNPCSAAPFFKASWTSFEPCVGQVFPDVHTKTWWRYWPTGRWEMGDGRSD